MKGSRIMENIAGMESTANGTSEVYTIAKVIASGVPAHRQSSLTKKWVPWNSGVSGNQRRMTRKNRFRSGSNLSSRIKNIFSEVEVSAMIKMLSRLRDFSTR